MVLLKDDENLCFMSCFPQSHLYYSGVSRILEGNVVVFTERTVLV